MLLRNSLFISVFICCLLGAKGSFSQSSNDSLPYNFDFQQQWQNPINISNSGLYLNNPSILNPQIEYDSESGNYFINQNSNGFRISNPSYLTFEEYNDYNSSSQKQSYWKQKISSSSLTDENKSKGPLSIDIGGEVFDKIFGNSSVDIRPQGSAELIFSIKHNNTENPSVALDRQATTSFDFKQKIQMNVIGKIGDKLQLNTNYNTEATFDFDNKINLEYVGKEDEIIKKIELGNVGLPLNGTLITGSQSLLGVKAQLQFGRATVTTIVSQQKSSSKIIDVEGGAQTTDFDIYADQYEANKHFFLSHYFKDQYDQALQQLPYVNSAVNITKIEVWVTNKTGTVENTRNILAFLDLAESQQNMFNTDLFSTNPSFIYPDNQSNSLYEQMLSEGEQLRNLNQISSVFSPSNYPGFIGSQDYEKLERARLLSPSEYTLHPQLGYISLNSVIGPDEVLAVAYQYTVGGQSFQVGEFASSGPSAPNSLYLKLLKNINFSPVLPNWDLMMKNIYSLGAYNLSQEEFFLDVVFENTRDNGAITNYIPDGNLNGQPLIKILGLDQLNSQQESRSDGIFDFIPGLTIISSNGRIIFPVREPFGEYLREKITDTDLADIYSYDILYDSTLNVAQQFPEFNKFRLKGSYQSESGSEIYLGVLSVEEGSVVVTAGGVKLEEGSDYTVNYGMGKVNIINDGILLSGTPIRIAVESNTFGLVRKALIGSHIDYRVSDDFMLGGTILNLTERPYTNKVNTGDEPISNTIWGIDGTYRTKSTLLTKIVDKIPFLDTKEESSITATAEFAHLIPGHQRAVGKEGTAYIDDFEASSTGIDIKNPGSWFLASIPFDPVLFPESQLPNQAPRLGNLASGFNRGLLSWYNIETTFYRNNQTTPDHIQADLNQLSNHNVREVYEKEVFPNKDPQFSSQISNIPLMNITYNPTKRGPYNFDVDNINSNGDLLYPELRWAGIMRKIESTDFETQNIEFLEFWVMDPFNDDSENESGGTIILNLGNVSEDVLKDGFKSYENGLPTTENIENLDTSSSVWGYMPSTFALTNTFDAQSTSRSFQDVGYDGLRDVDERVFFDTSYVQKIVQKFGNTSQAYTNAFQDPAGDNFQYFLGDDLDAQQSSILSRYEYYSGIDGNSDLPNPNTASSTSIPNTEDINFDNTLNETESYFQYEIPIYPEMQVGESFISDIQETQVETVNGQTRKIKWYQFKVPVQQPSKTIGSIRDFKSIRFIRMIMKDFDEPITLRLASLELVRGEWRRYNFDLQTEGEYVPNDNENNTIFDVSVVNIEENGERIPIPYVLPPGVEQEIDNTTTSIRKQNEQSLVLKVCDLEDGDSRAAYKSFNNDFRTYKRIKMYVHAEASGEDESSLNDNDLHLFIRLGTDFNDNFYEYSIPLKLTPWGTSQTEDDIIWPLDNEIDVAFEVLQNVKKLRNKAIRDGLLENTSEIYKNYLGDKIITVVGNPNLSQVKTIMLGIRNPKKGNNLQTSFTDDGLSKCGEIWLNELRLTDFDQRGGYAANARLNARLADFANVNFSGSMSTVGFGTIEQSLNSRQKYDAYQYDASSTFALGDFFSEKAGLKIPMYVGMSEAIQTPQYNPLDPDITLKESLNELPNEEERDSLKSIVQDFTKRKSINFTNIRKAPSSDKSKKPKIYDVENFSLTYSRNELNSRNLSLQERTTIDTRAGLNYNFSSAPKNIKPFSKVKLFKNKYFRLLRDFNFYTRPKSISFQTNLNRYYNKTQFRNINSDFVLDPSYSKGFLWNRNYNIKYDLTRTLKTEFKVRNSASIDEPYGEISKLDPYYKEKRDTILNNLLNFGRPTIYHHDINVSYNVPINKFPLTDWISLTTKYSASFDWIAAPVAIQQLGNTIQNNNSKQINSTFNLTQLYKKVPYLNKVNKKLNTSNRARNGSRNTIILPADQDTVRLSFKDYLDHVANFAMMVKNVSLSYTQNHGTVLPGFSPKPGFFGQDWSQLAPGIPFALGVQNLGIDTISGANGWLTSDSTLNQYTRSNNSETLNLRSTVEPFKGFRIELTASRINSESSQSIFRANSSGDYESFNPIESGSYSVSFISWNTAFVRDFENHSSQTFQEFRNNRLIIANRLAALNPNPNPIDSTGFPVGYQETSDEVLISSFLAAYAGKDPNNVSLNKFPSIPLPNWRINYDGLKNLKWFSKRFKTITMSHSYRSTYSVGSYVTNLDYEDYDRDGWADQVNEATNNYFSQYEYNQITLRESLSPLFKIDMTLKNSVLARVEIKKDRTLTLGLSNNQLTERSTSELIIGSGYRLKDLTFNVRAAGKQNQVKSDLDIKLDFSIRTNKVVIRQLVENLEEITGGNSVLSLKLTADYVVSSRLNLRLFYDRVFTNPYVTSSFKTAVSNGGFSIRFTLAQ